jgi:hypothetical protein
MKKTLLILLFFLIHFGSLSQGNMTKEVEFETFRLKIENQAFNLVEVIDSRFVPHIYGKLSKKRANYNFTNYMDMESEVQNWFNSTYSYDPKLPNIVLKLNYMEILDYKSIEPECNGSIDIYLKKANSYVKLAEYNSQVYGKFKYLPFSLINDALSTISTELIEQRLKEDRKGIDFNEYDDPFINDFKPKVGVYQFFEDFKRDSPSDYYTEKLKHLDLSEHKMNFYLGKWKNGNIIYDDKTIKSDFWGFSDGVNVFYRVRDNFFVKLLKYQDKFYFDTKNIEYIENSFKKKAVKDYAKNIVSSNIIGFFALGMYESFTFDFRPEILSDKFFLIDKKTGRFKEIKEK